jgi:hypothetical protein
MRLAILFRPTHRPRCDNRRSGLAQRLLLCWALATVATGTGNTMELMSGQRIILQGQGRAVLLSDETGHTRPLWDGIHRLRDGSSITVRNGVLQSDALLPDALQELRRTEGGLYTRCEALVRKVCGERQECASAPGCGPARQLLDMERQERRPDSPGSVVTSTSELCNDALGDEEFFAPCRPAPR